MEQLKLVVNARTFVNKVKTFPMETRGKLLFDEICHGCIVRALVVYNQQRACVTDEQQQPGATLLQHPVLVF